PDLGGLALGRADQVDRRRLAVRAAPARTTLGRLAAVIAPAGHPGEPLPLLRHLAFEAADLVGERPQGLLREPTDAVHRGSPVNRIGAAVNDRLLPDRFGVARRALEQARGF